MPARFADGPYRKRRGVLHRLPDGAWPAEVVVPDPTSETTSTLVYRVDAASYPAVLRWQGFGPPMAILQKRGEHYILLGSEDDIVLQGEDITGGWVMVRDGKVRNENGAAATL